MVQPKENNVCVNIEVKDCVFAVCGDDNVSTFQGTAFCIEDYIITAGHVLPHSQMFSLYDGEMYYEKYPNFTGFVCLPSEKEKIDLTVYKESNKSPLKLASKLPLVGTKMGLVCWQKNEETLEQVSCSCTIKGYDSSKKRFYALIDRRITHGSSGCPVVKDGLVYGVLTDGYDKNKYNQLTAEGRNQLKQDKEKYGEDIEDCCFFLPATEIRTRLSLINIKK